jgi:hypothetical protein
VFPPDIIRAGSYTCVQEKRIYNEIYAFQRSPFVFASCVPDTGNGWDNCRDNGTADVTYVSFTFERDPILPWEMRVYDDIILDHQMRMGGHEGLKIHSRRIYI